MVPAVHPELVDVSAWLVVVVRVPVFPESPIELDLIVPPLPLVPWTVTVSPGRTEWPLTLSDLLMLVVESSLTWTVSPDGP